jgi:glycosyltransferase involved in cell wall biosynthesis
MIYYLVPETITNPAVQSQAVSIALALRSGLEVPVSYWGFMKADPLLHDQAENIRSELNREGIETNLFVIKREKGIVAVLKLLALVTFRLRKQLKKQPGQVLVRNLYGAQLAYVATLGVKGASYTVDLRGHTGAEWEMTGVMRTGSLKAKLFYCWERFLLKHASSVLCVSSVLADYVEETTKQKTQCFVIPSCLDKMLEKELEASQTVGESVKSDQITLAYAGTVTSWNRVDTMVTFFERLSTLLPKVHFLCITTHVEKAKESFASTKLDSVNYSIIRVPHEEIISTLRKADVGLLLRDKSMVNQVASPVKAAEYMTAGLAVVVSDGVGDLSDSVKENQLGLVLDSLDPEAWNDNELLDFFQDVMSNRDMYKVRSINFAKEFFVRKNYLRQYREALQAAN